MLRAAHFLALLLCLVALPAAADPPPEAPLAYRMVDGFAPFYDPEQAPPRSWAMPFAHLDRSEAPYVHEEHLQRSVARFERYCAHVSALGYDAVFLGNLIHFASFEGVQGGPVYAEQSPYRIRHARYRAALKECVDAARRHGVRVVVETDFPAWTPELEAWLGSQGLSLENPRLWEAYRAAIRELFLELGVHGLQVRIGEGGGAYDEGLRYRSTVAVRSVSEAQRLLEGLLAIVDEVNAESKGGHRLIFRTWTIGIGEIGALHTDPAIYEEVFRPFYGREALVTSIKHVAMDFFQHVPTNRTIGVGELPQIVEFQARREYEGFGLFPNYRAEPFREALRGFRQRPSFQGIVVWPTNGGFLLEARTAYRTAGLDRWIDANVHAYGRLSRDSSLEPKALAAEWVRSQGVSLEDAPRAAEVLLQSEDLVGRGLYIGPYAENAPALFGLDVFPTMLWLYWTRPAGSHGVHCLLGRYARQDLPRSLGEGQAALTQVAGMIASAEALGPSSFREDLLRSLRYEESLLRVMAELRVAWLQHHAWALEGKAGAYEAWQESLPRLEAAIAAHERDWSGDSTLPAMDLRELKRLLRDDQRYPTLRWLAGLAGLLVLVVALLSALQVRAAPPPVLERIPTAALVIAGVALSGLIPALCLAWHRAPLVASAGAGLALLVYLSSAGPLALSQGDVDAARSPWRVALGALAPLLLGAALLALVYAARGIVPLFALAVECFFSGAALAGLVTLTLAAALLQATALLLAARRAVEGWGRRVALALCSALVSLAVTGGLTAWRGVPGLLTWNEITRFAPSILGQAGTDPADLAK